MLRLTLFFLFGELFRYLVNLRSHPPFPNKSKPDRKLLVCKTFQCITQDRLQNSRFRKAGSAVSVILECEAREPHTPRILPRRFFTRSSLSCEYGPSLAFAKNTAVLQSSLKTTNITNT